MPASTRSQKLSTEPPPATSAPAKRGRKRKATEPAQPAEEPIQAANLTIVAPESADGPSTSAPGTRAKRTRTNAAGSSPNVTSASPVNSVPAPTPTAPSLTTLPAPVVAQDIPALIPEPITIDDPAEPTILPDPWAPSGSDPSASSAAEGTTNATPTGVVPSDPSIIGDNTRNRQQRAPTLRDENTALAKANAELEARVKQMASDIRTLKKFKVMWVKEYSKKAKADAQVLPSSLIPRPPGEKGKNGWNLQEAMGLTEDEPLYTEILRSVRHCISRSGLDWESTYSEQEPARIALCFKELKKQHPYLERFQGDWPAKEMVISALQNRRKALNAKTKAKLANDKKTQGDMTEAEAAVDLGNID